MKPTTAAPIASSWPDGGWSICSVPWAGMDQGHKRVRGKQWQNQWRGRGSHRLEVVGDRQEQGAAVTALTLLLG